MNHEMNKRERERPTESKILGFIGASYSGKGHLPLPRLLFFGALQLSENVSN